MQFMYSIVYTLFSNPAQIQNLLTGVCVWLFIFLRGNMHIHVNVTLRKDYFS